MPRKLSHFTLLPFLKMGTVICLVQSGRTFSLTHIWSAINFNHLTVSSAPSSSSSVLIPAIPVELFFSHCLSATHNSSFFKGSVIGYRELSDGGRHWGRCERAEWLTRVLMFVTSLKCSHHFFSLLFVVVSLVVPSLAKTFKASITSWFG